MEEYEDELFPFLLLQSAFLPLQGVFNLLIFCRPKYLRARQDYPLETRFWCFRRAMYGWRIKERHQEAARNRHVTNTSVLPPDADVEGDGETPQAPEVTGGTNLIGISSIITEGDTKSSREGEEVHPGPPNALRDP